MATNARTAENSTEPQSVPASASLVGIDGDGDRHYVGYTPREGSVVIYVKGAGVERHDLAETPCSDQPDAVRAWIAHTERHRGDWEHIAYERPAVQRLADAGAI